MNSCDRKLLRFTTLPIGVSSHRMWTCVFLMITAFVTQNLWANEPDGMMKNGICSAAFSTETTTEVTTTDPDAGLNTNLDLGLNSASNRPVNIATNVNSRSSIQDEDLRFFEELLYLNALYPAKKNIFSKVVDHQTNPDFKIISGATKFKNPKFQPLFQAKRQLTFFRPTAYTLLWWAVRRWRARPPAGCAPTGSASPSSEEPVSHNRENTPRWRSR